MDTPLGRQLRIERAKRGMLLKHLADLMKVSVTWLSSIETGAKQAPADFVAKCATAMKLSPKEQAELQEAADQSRHEYRFKVDREAGSSKREFMALLTRRFDELDDSAFVNLRGVLKKGGKDGG